VMVDLAVPTVFTAKSVALHAATDSQIATQPISLEKSGSFVDGVWDVPTIVDSTRIKLYAQLTGLPALGYRAYQILPQPAEQRGVGTLVTGPNSMENAFLRVQVNGNGAIDLLDKETGACYTGINYLLDQGESGNAWNHKTPRFDRVYNSLGVSANVAVTTSGPLVSIITADYTFPVPVSYLDVDTRSDTLVGLPVRVEYRLERDARLVTVTMTIDNRASDHWLRVAFPTGITTNVSWADSHFDVVSRAIPLPDCTGWVEQAWGTHPLRTFVDLTDGRRGFALLPKGLFEYEVFEDDQHTLALTLIRGCRIKLAVSEEKQAELPDPGVQCPGVHTFAYALCPHAGDWTAAGLPTVAASYDTPVRAVMTGRGKGALPLEAGLFTLDTTALHVTAVKQAEDGDGLIVRLVNLQSTTQSATLTFTHALASADECRNDETPITALSPQGARLPISMGAKKIRSFRLRW